MRSKFIFSNLRLKVMLLFLLVALVPLGIVAMFSIRTAKELIMSMASNQLGNVANDKTSLLERWILERRADLQVIASSSSLQSMDTEQIAPFIKLVEKYYGVYRGFMVVSHEGSIIFDDLGIESASLWEECCQQPFAGRLYLSEIKLDPKRRKSFFYISAPVVDQKNRVKGSVCAAVDTHTIISVVLKVSLGQSGECYLVNKDGIFLAHKEPGRILTENIAQSGSFKNIFAQGNSRRLYIDYRGIEVLGASRKIADTDWYLVVEQDRDEAFKSVDRLKNYVYLVVSVSLFASIFLAWLLSYYIVHPLRKLSEATKILARGEFERAKVETKRVDEIGVLYRTFEDMARQLKMRQNNLEKKVDSTEAELKKTDGRLKMVQLAAARSEQLAALGRLAAGVTHEIRTPLTSLKLFLESIPGEVENLPEYQEDFQIAMHQIRRIEATINRFLDFAKPQEPIFSPVEIEQLIEDALLVIKPRANQQETVVEVTMERGLPAIKGDREQLAEALLNLMVNALEAMVAKGKLMISASLSQGEESGKSAGWLRIDIVDTGPGIAEEHLSKLFDPFFTTKASGTGLGLSIVWSTIQKHGGNVKISSMLGNGTAFSLFLPIANREIPVTCTKESG